MNIQNSTLDDISVILKLYGYATSYQIRMGAIPWPKFEKEMIQKEIDTEQQWKIIIDNQIACVWMTTFDDPYIWEERNEDPSVYIHRIATNPDFRGHHFVKSIISWACNYAKENNKSFIRMDTAGHNDKLISYYTNCGFTFLGANTLKNTKELAEHYKNAPINLFEMKV
ncbi:GNAT family N-acetyltransferase [Aquimarina sp. AU119]|uniref:GNAT family N-acetyltransferase n=1 Tax=Aquimarina sp. AU119 TaxID=2108528 RepID=UPI000D69188D|nr:GNAT family N-acetyltransferase [Aquimarina sp. AU119]